MPQDRDETKLTRTDLPKEFNEAAEPEKEVEADYPEPKLDLQPTELAGPGLGDAALGAPGLGGALVSPQLRGSEPEREKPRTPLVRREFNEKASGGYARAKFNQKARERDDDHGLER